MSTAPNSIPRNIPIIRSIYLARGCYHAGNVYADPTRKYDELSHYRVKHGKTGH